jgi:hypothetical protein
MKGSGSTPLNVGGVPVSIDAPAPVTAPSIIDANNTTTTLLAGDASFEGTFTDALEVVQIVVRFSADVPGTLYLENSINGVTQLGSSLQVSPSSTFILLDFTPTTRYFRFRFTNGAAAQGSFTLNTRINRVWGALTNSASQQVNDFTRVLTVRQITDPRLDEASGKQQNRAVIGKFGANPDVAAGAEEFIWAGATAGYTGFLTTAKTLRVKAGNTNDTAGGSGAQAVTLVFLNSTWEEVTETLATAGTSASAATSVTAIRLIRAYCTDNGVYSNGLTGGNAAAVFIETSDGASIMGSISTGVGQTQLGTTTVPLGKQAFIREVGGSSDATKPATLRFWQRQNADDVTTPFTGRRLIFGFEAFSGTVDKQFTVYRGPYPAKTDIWATGIGPTGGSAMSADLDIVLVDE